jgi:hypothetical protein
MAFLHKYEHRSETEAIFRAFLRKAEGLFSVTRPLEILDRHKGIYGIAYVRCARRVARLLSADRELLLIVSTFRDQQPRTIQLATDLIDDSDGRLENTIAIILHSDDSGNAKLKNWGREQGLSVIPLFVRDQQRLPVGEELERLLFSEFYSHDPFDVTGPVFEDSQFYGRRDEAQDLARHLQKGQVRAAMGMRRIGKTSVINRVLFVAEDYHNCYSVMIDCSKDVVWGMSAAQLLAAIADGVERASKDEEYHAEVTSPQDELTIGDAYKALTDRIRSMNVPVILFFDEVDYITPSSPTAADKWRTDFNPFWRNLRAAYQEISRTSSTLSIFVSGVSSKWFRVESIDGIENAALAFVPEEYLSPIPSRAAVAMVQDIGRVAGLIFESDVAGVITEACSNIPFWIRKAGSHVHRNLETNRRPFRPTSAMVSTLVDAFIDSEGSAVAGFALSHLFRVYPELEPVARACHARSTANHKLYLLRILERYGVVSYIEKHKDWAISGKMMKAGMRNYMELAEEPKSNGVSSNDNNSIRFESVDEWADELAALSSLRNKLERRLRSVAVNFIRFDTLTNKQKGSLSERVLRVVDPQRRLQLQPLSPDEALDRYNWTDLVSLIQREWSLFAPIFADKVKFAAHCEVINRRYDAHAKDADRADVAEYRRSIKWLDDALSKT